MNQRMDTPKTFLIGLCLLLAATAQYNSYDPSSYANLDEVRTTHLNLSIAVEFDNRLFDGTVMHTMRAMQDNVSSVWLDSLGMDIHRVSFISCRCGCQNWTDVEFKVSQPNF